MTIPGPDGIEVDVWNDGIFMVEPLRYEDGVMLNMFIARLKYLDFMRMVVKRTNCAHLFAAYYRMPQLDLEKGLVKLCNDYDLMHMYDLSKKYGGVEVFLDHCNIDLSEYLAEPDPSTLSDGTSRKRPTPEKRYCNEFTQEEMESWAEKEAEEEPLVNRGKGIVINEQQGREKAILDAAKGKAVMVVDNDTGSKGKAIMVDHSDTASKGKATMVVESDSDSGDAGMLDGSESDDSEYSQKSIDHLSPGEEEVIQLRTRKANRSKTRHTPIPDMGGSASTSRSNPSNKAEVFIEHDEFIGDLLRKLKGDGEDSDLQDPFLGVQENQEKYPAYDPSTHWRSQLPEVMHHLNDFVSVEYICY